MLFHLIIEEWDSILHLFRDYLPIVTVMYFLIYNGNLLYRKSRARKKEAKRKAEERIRKISLIQSYPYKSYFSMAYQHLAQIQYGQEINANVRKISIETWHKIVLAYQEKYCEALLSFIHLEGVEFEYAVKRYSEEHLSEVIIELQETLGVQLEQFYSSNAYPLRNLLERKIFRILEDKDLDTPTKILQIFQEIKDYCSCTKSVAEAQIILNGKLKGLRFATKDPITDEITHYEFL